MRTPRIFRNSSQFLGLTHWRLQFLSAFMRYPTAALRCRRWKRDSAGRLSVLRRGWNKGKETMMWTDERVELLKKLWADGLSASQIAAELGGITRNAVIGKVHRLGLSGRAETLGNIPGHSSPKNPSRNSRWPRVAMTKA